MDEDCDLAEDFDCPSLLCEELEDLETKNDHGSVRRRRGREGGEVFNQRVGEETGEETEREGEEEDEEEEEKVVEGDEEEEQIRLGEEETSYPTSQPQPQASLPRMAFLTPSPYLTPNPPDSNPTSYLTFGPGGSSTGMVTYSTGGHTYFQSQNAGQILLQSAGHHGGITAYQSYPWGNMYSQPAIHQRAQCPPTYPTNLAGARDHQPPSSTALPALILRPGGPRSLTSKLPALITHPYTHRHHQQHHHHCAPSCFNPAAFSPQSRDHANQGSIPTAFSGQPCLSRKSSSAPLCQD
ncbi:hypothetical protein GBF38_011123 [Nibea albiflora]|uniref:Uncharacterized protein n=1 Tax=Nibea albiflora TaxID=240163 RepID=A0ACB7ETU9_NIBAL|nr:hypothetical protein GBF38_011123 [Nibea albiflora]